MTEEELKDYALRGMRAEVYERAGEVKMGMVRMKEALDRAVSSAINPTAMKPTVDNLMEALVGFSEAMERVEKFKEVQQ